MLETPDRTPKVLWARAAGLFGLSAAICCVCTGPTGPVIERIVETVDDSGYDAIALKEIERGA